MARKNPEIIINQIFAELEKGEAKSTNEIAVSMKSNIKTVKDYIHLIEIIQAKPRVLVDRAKNVTLVRIEKTG